MNLSFVRIVISKSKLRLSAEFVVVYTHTYIGNNPNMCMCIHYTHRKKYYYDKV